MPTQRGFEATQKPPLLQRIQGRSLEWIRQVFGFVEVQPDYTVLNQLRLTVPFPGTSLWTPEDTSLDDTTDVGTGADLPLALSLPVAGTLRHWLIVSVFTGGTVTIDMEYGVQFGGINCPIAGSAGFSNDDASSMTNLLCHSGMNPYAVFRNATIGASYTIRGIFLDYPEGEVPSIPTLTAMSLAT